MRSMTTIVGCELTSYFLQTLVCAVEHKVDAPLVNCLKAYRKRAREVASEVFDDLDGAESRCAGFVLASHARCLARTAHEANFAVVDYTDLVSLASLKGEVLSTQL